MTGHRLGNRWAHSASLRSSWDAVSGEPQVGTAVSPIRTHGDGQSTRFPILCSEFPIGRGRCAPEADTNTESGSRGRLVTAHTGRMQMTGPARCTRLWATRCRSTTTPAVRWRATSLLQCNRDVLDELTGSCGASQASGRRGRLVDRHVEQRASIARRALDGQDCDRPAARRHGAEPHPVHPVGAWRGSAQPVPGLRPGTK